jgi:hypothetical protein
METKINSEENTGGSMAMLSFYFLYGEPGLRLSGRNIETTDNSQVDNNK